MTELTDEQINKRIHELMGLCWHELANENVNLCRCGTLYGNFTRINFTTSWEGFGILWEWLQKHEQFWAFCNNYGEVCKDKKWLPISLISPPTLSSAVVEFFEEVHD